MKAALDYFLEIAASKAIDKSRGTSNQCPGVADSGVYVCRSTVGLNRGIRDQDVDQMLVDLGVNLGHFGASLATLVMFLVLRLSFWHG